MPAVRRTWLGPACAVLAVSLAGASCATEDDPGGTQAPDIGGSLILSASELAQGEEFTATFADDRVVPGDFSLAVWNGTDWTYQYQLFGSDEPFVGDAQAWRTWRERTSYLPDEEVGGGRPIHLVVPSRVISGDFRLCAESPGSREQDACAGLRIVDDGNQ